MIARVTRRKNILSYLNVISAPRIKRSAARVLPAAARRMWRGRRGAGAGAASEARAETVPVLWLELGVRGGGGAAHRAHREAGVPGRAGDQPGRCSAVCDCSLNAV